MKMREQFDVKADPESSESRLAIMTPFAQSPIGVFGLAVGLVALVCLTAIFAFNQPIAAALSLAGVAGGVFFLGVGAAGRVRADDARALEFIERIRFAYVVLDEHRRVSSMNDRARRLLGLADAEWQGCKWQTLLGGSATEAFPAELPDEGVRWSAVRPDCAATGIRYQLLPFQSGGRSLHVLLLQDVGDVVSGLRAESESARIRTAACLATQIAHEVRNPVAAISGSAQLLGILNEKARQGDARSVELLASEQDALCRSIVEESHRLDVIIGRFLSFSDLSEDSLRTVMELPEIKEDADSEPARMA